MKKQNTVDACVICALPEEARAFLDVLQQYCREVPLEEHVSSRYHFNYRSMKLKNQKNEVLNLHISGPQRYGPQEMTLHISHVLEECQPRIAIMTGICAGNSMEVQLGDLVVAERTFFYDASKFVAKEDEHKAQLHDIETEVNSLDVNVARFLGSFTNWQPLVARLRQPPRKEQIQCRIAPIASSSVKYRDDPFKDVHIPMRGTVAIDMEGEAFYQTLRNQPGTPGLIVKGVSEYVDRRNKNDHSYRQYAAHASAIYALCFIQSYITSERPPRVDKEKEHAFALLQRIKQEAKECAKELDLPESAGYNVLAVIHGQALLGKQTLPTEMPIHPTPLSQLVPSPSFEENESQAMEKTVVTRRYSAALKQARLKKQWTLEEAAEALGVDVHILYSWEQGIQRPRRRTIKQLCQVFKVTAEELGF